MAHNSRKTCFCGELLGDWQECCIFCRALQDVETDEHDGGDEDEYEVCWDCAEYNVLEDDGTPVAAVTTRENYRGGEPTALCAECAAALDACRREKGELPDGTYVGCDTPEYEDAWDLSNG